MGMEFERGFMRMPWSAKSRVEHLTLTFQTIEMGLGKEEGVVGGFN